MARRKLKLCTSWLAARSSRAGGCTAATCAALWITRGGVRTREPRTSKQRMGKDWGVWTLDAKALQKAKRTSTSMRSQPDESGLAASARPCGQRRLEMPHHLPLTLGARSGCRLKCLVFIQDIGDVAGCCPTPSLCACLGLRQRLAGAVLAHPSADLQWYEHPTSPLQQTSRPNHCMALARRCATATVTEKMRPSNNTTRPRLRPVLPRIIPHPAALHHPQAGGTVRQTHTSHIAHLSLTKVIVFSLQHQPRSSCRNNPLGIAACRTGLRFLRRLDPGKPYPFKP